MLPVQDPSWNGLLQDNSEASLTTNVLPSLSFNSENQDEAFWYTVIIISYCILGIWLDQLSLVSFHKQNYSTVLIYKHDDTVYANVVGVMPP